MRLHPLLLKRSVLLLALVAAPAVLSIQSGCVAVVAAGAAGTGVAWYSGRLEANLGHDLIAVYKASQKALAQLEFAKISENKSSIDAQLVSRTALDKKVDIVLTQVTPKSTKVAIRVGVFGDEALSLTVLDKIKANL